MKTIAKKEYNTPIIEIYHMELQQVIAASTLNPLDASPSVTVGGGTYTGGFGAHESDEDFD